MKRERTVVGANGAVLAERGSVIEDAAPERERMFLARHYPDLIDPGSYGTLPDVVVRRLDRSTPLLCFGGPLDGEMWAHDGLWMRAIVPSPVAWVDLHADPFAAATLDTVEYRRERFGYRGWTAWAWVLDEAQRERVVQTLNLFINLAGVRR